LYGSPNIHAELANDHGIRVGRKRVARLMQAGGCASEPTIDPPAMPKYVANGGQCHES